MARRTGTGQAAVELALALPLVCILLLAVVQVGVVAHAHLLVVHAALEGARAAAVTERPGAAREAAVRALGGDVAHLEVAESRTDTLVSVVVSRPFTGNVPLVGSLLRPPRLQARVSMQRED